MFNWQVKRYLNVVANTKEHITAELVPVTGIVAASIDLKENIDAAQQVRLKKVQN